MIAAFGPGQSGNLWATLAKAMCASAVTTVRARWIRTARPTRQLGHCADITPPR